MRIRYDRPAGGGRSDANIIAVDWRQEWFANLCLSVILAVILFLMLLSIYLVFSKPAPVSTPNPNRTGAAVGGTAFADNRPNVDFLLGDGIGVINRLLRSFESANKSMG